DVDEVQRDEAGAAGELSVGADPSDVVRVGQGHGDDAGLAAAGDRGVHRLAGDRATVSATAAEHQHRAVVLPELRPGGRHDEPGLQVADVGRDHSDAMTVVAHQVRAHEMV